MEKFKQMKKISLFYIFAPRGAYPTYSQQQN